VKHESILQVATLVAAIAVAAVAVALVSRRTGTNLLMNLSPVKVDARTPSHVQRLVARKHRLLPAD